MRLDQAVERAVYKHHTGDPDFNEDRAGADTVIALQVGSLVLDWELDEITIDRLLMETAKYTDFDLKSFLTEWGKLP